MTARLYLTPLVSVFIWHNSAASARSSYKSMNTAETLCSVPYVCAPQYSIEVFNCERHYPHQNHLSESQLAIIHSLKYKP